MISFSIFSRSGKKRAEATEGEAVRDGSVGVTHLTIVTSAVSMCCPVSMLQFHLMAAAAAALTIFSFVCLLVSIY